MAARSLQRLFDEYSSHHRNPTNVLVHWICVPVIFFSVIGLLASLPPADMPLLGPVPWAKTVIGVVLVFFYLPRSLAMMAAMALWSLFCLMVAIYLKAHAPWPLWAICLVLFAVAWIGQFWGHKIEGQKPSFLKDLIFLLIGPAWLMAKVMKKVGVSF